MFLFFHHRCGSQAIMDCLRNSKDPLSGNLATAPPASFRRFVYGETSFDDVLENPDLLWFAYLGHWWGDTPADQIPEPEDDEGNMWRASELQRLHKTRIATIIRDGRNQVESLRRVLGGAEEDRQNKDSKDWFRFCCKAWRNRAAWAFQCKSSVSGFHIFKFEDFYRQPYLFLDSLLRFFEFKPDDSALMEKIDNWFAREAITESSFQDKSEMNIRWLKWGPEEIKIFWDTCGLQMRQLGYDR